MKKYDLLWIEDDAYVLMGLVEPLHKAGCQIDIALDVEKGKHRLSEKKYDLIILDIILPSGKELRTEEDLKNVEKFYGLKFLQSLPEDSPPILVLSVVNDADLVKEIRKFPKVKDVLLKGTVKPSQLKKIVMEILVKKFN